MKVRGNSMRGKEFHNYQVDIFASNLESQGWIVRKEYPISLGNKRKNYADITAWKSGKILLVEVETTTRHLLDNIAKAAALNLPLIVILPNRKTLNAAKGKYKGWKKPPRCPPVIFLLISQLSAQKTRLWLEKHCFSTGGYRNGNTGKKEK